MIFRIAGKVSRILFRCLLIFTTIFLAYTVYSVFSVPFLCSLEKKDPGMTAFMERRMEEWEEKGNSKKKIDQRWVPLTKISRHLQNAVLQAEDPNFYRHHGFDFYQIKLAFKENWEEGKVIRGASTITQQLMKNLYLSPSQNPFRKWREAILTVRAESCLKKKRMLEIYLNVIEWGDSIYGVEAASRRYFGKSAASLNPGESALLAAMIPNPVARNPYKKSRALYRKKNAVLRLMYKSGNISKAQYYEAINSGVRLR